MFIKYERKNIKLRPLHERDMIESIVWRNDPEIRDNVLGYRLPVTEEMEKDWYKSALNDQSKSRIIFAIETKKDQQLIGFIYLYEIDWISRVSKFGIMIGDKKMHGKGCGREAIEIILDYARNCLGLRKIWLEVAEYNQRAAKLYDSLKFKQEGILIDHVYFKKIYYNIIIMSKFL